MCDDLNCFWSGELNRGEHALQAGEARHRRPEEVWQTVWPGAKLGH
jgi:hypothetical protein